MTKIYRNAVRRQFVAEMVRIGDSYLSEDARDHSKLYSTHNPLRHLFLLLKIHPHINNVELSELWRIFYDRCAGCLLFHSKRNIDWGNTVATECAELAVKCLEMLDEFEPADGSSEADFDAWAARFVESASFFPNELFIALASVKTPNQDVESKRLKLLRTPPKAVRSAHTSQDLRSEHQSPADSASKCSAGSPHLVVDMPQVGNVTGHSGSDSPASTQGTGLGDDNTNPGIATGSGILGGTRSLRGMIKGALRLGSK